MADRIVTERLCDFCMADEIETTGAERYVLFGFEVDASAPCGHAKPLDELRAAVEALGRKVPVRATSITRPASDTDRVTCPECGKSFKNRGSLGSHSRETHGKTIRELDGGPAPALEHPCPECERVFGSPQGVAVHRWRMHGYKAEPSNA